MIYAFTSVKKLGIFAFTSVKKLGIFLNFPCVCVCVCVCVLSLTVCNPVDYSLPGSSVHGIFQARILEWVAISFS